MHLNRSNPTAYATFKSRWAPVMNFISEVYETERLNQSIRLRWMYVRRYFDVQPAFLKMSTPKSTCATHRPQIKFSHSLHLINKNLLITHWWNWPVVPIREKLTLIFNLFSCWIRPKSADWFSASIESMMFLPILVHIAHIIWMKAIICLLPLLLRRIDWLKVTG